MGWRCQKLAPRPINKKAERHQASSLVETDSVTSRERGLQASRRALPELREPRRADERQDEDAF